MLAGTEGLLLVIYQTLPRRKGKKGLETDGLSPLPRKLVFSIQRNEAFPNAILSLSKRPYALSSNIDFYQILPVVDSAWFLLL